MPKKMAQMQALVASDFLKINLHQRNASPMSKMLLSVPLSLTSLVSQESFVSLK